MEDYLIKLVETGIAALCVVFLLFIFGGFGWLIATYALGLPGGIGILGGDGVLALLAFIAFLRTMGA